MATNQLKDVVRHLYHLSSRVEFDASSDQQLLQRFVSQRDEHAFAGLLRRHGAMVWGVCCRVLGHCHDVEDAFQNTFLTLLRQAGSIRWRESIEGWLHKVAHDLATKTKLARQRRRAHEQRRATRQSERCTVPDCPWELPEILDKELKQLPEKYRSPLILCYLEGLTWSQAAQRLGISLRTLEWRLSQGRERLRRRLTRRGMDLGPMTLLAVLSPGATFRQVPAELLATLLQAARILLKSPNLVGTGIATQAARLIQEIPGKYTMKTKMLLGMLLTLITVGGGVLSYSAWVQPQEKEAGEQPPVVSQATATSDTLPTRTDCYGDPLPPGALARLGTVRFRPCSHSDGDLLAFTPDGKGLLTAVHGKPISLWERETGKLLRRFGDFPIHFPNSRGATFAANGRIVAGWKAVRPGSTPGEPEDVLYVWETATGKLLRQFKGRSSRRRCAISADSQLLAIDLEGKFGLWEIATGRQFWKLQLKEGEFVEDVAFSRDSNGVSVAFERFKNGNRENSVCWWEARTGRLVRTWSDLGLKNIHHIDFSPDNSRLIVQSDDNGWRVHLLDWITGKVQSLGEAAHGMVCSPTGAMVATYKNQEGIILWDTATGKELRRLQKFFQWAPVFSLDGKILASTTREGNCLWDVATGKELRHCQNSRETGGILAFSPDGKILAGTEGTALSCWEVSSGKKLPQPREYQGFVHSVAFTPDGKSLVSIEGHGVHIWDAQSGQQRLTFPKGTLQHSAFLLRTGFSPDGKILAAGLDSSAPGKTSKYLDLWEVASGRILHRLEKPSENGFPQDLVFSPDGKYLAYELMSPKERKGNTFLWELATGKRLHHRFPGWALMFSPDGAILVTVQEEEEREGSRGVCCLWEIATGKKLGGIKEMISYPFALAFSPYGQAPAFVFSPYAYGRGAFTTTLVLSDTLDNKTKIKIPLYSLYRDPQFGVRVKIPRTLLEIDSEVRKLEFSPDGRMLAVSSGREDGTISLWETATGKELGRFHGHNDAVDSLAFSPDGRRLASGSSDTTILIWDITGRLDDHGRLRAARLSDKLMEERWSDLAGTNAARAHQSLWTLVAGGSPTVALCAKRLRPAPGVAAEILAQLIADLDSATFSVRQKARQRLEALGEVAEPSLHRALAKQPSLELRRSVDYLLAQVEEQRAKPSGEVLRGIRAIEVLEHIGTPAARQLLGTLSRGAPGVRQTKEAKAALQRLSRRAIQQPNG